MAGVKISRTSERDGEVADGAVAYAITAPVLLHRLDEELADLLGEKPGLVVDGDVAQASEEAPVTLWIMGGNEPSAAKLRNVVVDHDPTPEPDPLDPIRAKLEAGQALEPEEMHMAIQHLLKRG